MRVEIFVEDLARFFAEISSFTPGVQESGSQYHDGFACGLFQLDLDSVEFAVDDLDHSLDLLRSDGARA